VSSSGRTRSSTRPSWTACARPQSAYPHILARVPICSRSSIPGRAPCATIPMCTRLVTAGGLRDADQRWVPPQHRAFLVPGRALSRVFRGKVRAGFRRAGLLALVPPVVWRQEWVVHLQPPGTGEKVLEYLARYVFRIAVVNSRLERFADGQVTFRYRDGRTG